MNLALKFLLLSNSINILADYLFIPLYALFINKIGGGTQLAGILFGIRFISSAFFGVIIARFKDRRTLDNVLLEADFLLKGLSWLILAFSQNIATLIIIQTILGLANAVGAPAFNSLVSEHLDQKQHIHDWGVWELIQNSSVGLASVLGGFILATFGFTYLFILMAILEFTSLAVYHLTKKRAQAF